MRKIILALMLMCVCHLSLSSKNASADFTCSNPPDTGVIYTGCFEAVSINGHELWLWFNDNSTSHGQSLANNAPLIVTFDMGQQVSVEGTGDGATYYQIRNSEGDVLFGGDFNPNYINAVFIYTGTEQNPVWSLNTPTYSVVNCTRSMVDPNGNVVYSSSPAVDENPIPIPDTGQTSCYDDVGNAIPCPSPGEPFYGQDGNYSINPPSFTKLDSTGNPLPDEAASWSMVRDNVTGLIWEIKQDMDGTANYANPNDADNTYTWYDSNPATNGGWAGTPGDGTDTEDFINSLNSANFGGYNDWRMPNIKELITIVDYSIPYPGPTIMTAYFPNAYASNYWSSTTVANSTLYPGSALGVSFGGGGVSINYKHGGLYVRCIRGGQSSPSFMDNGNGTVTDTKTGFVWQQGEPGYMSWAPALSYCENLELPSGSGQRDWRLPNIKELESITDDTGYNPAIDTTFFQNAYASGYWSSTTYIWSDPGSAWGVFLDNGTVGGIGKYTGRCVRCVRGGQSEASANLTIILDPEDGGMVTGPGISCGNGNTDCQEEYEPGTEVTLTAEANDGREFQYWDDGVACYFSTDFTVILDTDKILTAKFKVKETVNSAIVNAAVSMIGQQSGQSSTHGSWLTDIAGGDGKRMRDAINIYDKWIRKNSAYMKYSPKQIEQRMISAFKGSNYGPNQKAQLVSRIQEVYNNSNTSVPQDDEATLQYMGIQRQCLEWAMSIVNSVGGNAKNYQTAVSAGSVPRNSVRPGMGYYVYRITNKGIEGGHAMIIIDAQYDSNGNLTLFKVAESNWGAEWENPPGEVPWERVVDNRNDRWLTYGAPMLKGYNKFVVVDYEK